MSPPTDSRLPASFYLALEEEVRGHAQGISEFDLLRRLQRQGFFAFLSPAPAPPAALFRAHFLLFHALYRLHDQLVVNQQGRLQISALCIRRLTWNPGSHALAAADRLRAYYLDWSNLDNTDEQAVADLLADFWRRFERLEDRADALAQLGLEDPVDDATIKLTWRRLAMAHHPDRGGDAAELQAINAAVDYLLG